MMPPRRVPLPDEPVAVFTPRLNVYEVQTMLSASLANQSDVETHHSMAALVRAFGVVCSLKSSSGEMYSVVAVTGAVTSKGVLTALVRPEAVAVSTYAVPARSMVRLLNVATPATAATLIVPDSVPPPEFAPTAIVTRPVKPVAVLRSEERRVG